MTTTEPLKEVLTKTKIRDGRRKLSVNGRLWLVPRLVLFPLTVRSLHYGIGMKISWKSPTYVANKMNCMRWDDVFFLLIHGSHHRPNGVQLDLFSPSLISTLPIMIVEMQGYPRSLEATLRTWPAPLLINNKKAAKMYTSRVAGKSHPLFNSYLFWINHGVSTIDTVHPYGPVMLLRAVQGSWCFAPQAELAKSAWKMIQIEYCPLLWVPTGIRRRSYWFAGKMVKDTELCG